MPPDPMALDLGGDAGRALGFLGVPQERTVNFLAQSTRVFLWTTLDRDAALALMTQLLNAAPFFLFMGLQNVMVQRGSQLFYLLVVRLSLVMKRMHLMLLCLEGGEELAGSLRLVLETVEAGRFEVRSEVLLRCSNNYSAIVSTLIARDQPSLTLMCLPCEQADVTALIFDALRQVDAAIPVVAVLEAGYNGDYNRLLDMGAADFILAPLRADDLLVRVSRLLNHRAAREASDGALREKLGLRRLIGENALFLAETTKIPKVAKCDATVLISGETGTGKELFARAIHYLSPRGGKPFIPINCGAIPSDLVENELFGHEAGAFTGATKSSPGLIHESDGGTLFLDEIDSLPASSQVKLLRFLQENEYRPVGSSKVYRVDSRVIAASNIDLESAVRSDRFRSDLYYRLNVIPICLPPLRRRPEDILLLARHRIGVFSQIHRLPFKELSPSAVQKLCAYAWPGNIRELENIIDRSLILSDDDIIGHRDIQLPELTPEQLSFKALKAKAIAEFETTYIRQVLAANSGNVTKAANAAKKNRRAFWQLMHKHRITFPRSVRVP